MTKKDFIPLADAIASLEFPITDRIVVIDTIGKVCASTNYNFDWDRWEKACNGEEYKH